ncbi:exostosin-1-like [Planococcus citri]|uniref:exostosin-1-like n=1 Tax=Planococcus citri TaxID=170843 RepID=UPI0031F73A64
MRAKKRFSLIFFCIVLFLYFYANREVLKKEELPILLHEELPSYFDSWIHELSQTNPEIGPSLALRSHSDIPDGDSRKSNFQSAITKKCRMETCFDFSKCRNGFKVYIYPEVDVEENEVRSALYQKIIDVVNESRYNTSDPNDACLFITTIDTLSRDRGSDDYVTNVPLKLRSLKYWNGGRNHLIFNLYSGSWPHYVEDDLGFDSGEAILAKASMSVTTMRPGFDISIPLFPKTHPKRGREQGAMKENKFPVNKKYLLAFKGKRYVHGIGSDTRNSLHHLHNDKDVIMLTTCQHGKYWEKWKDERCDEDNALYSKYDYQLLLLNSSFCLIPRGRRLGTFRFLEALQAGCIPVLLSNGWALPFEEVIDWSKAAILANEQLLYELPDIVRSISESKAFIFRQQTQILWEQYFSSIEKIVFTTFEIIRQRLPTQQFHDGLVWNTSPGALLTQNNLSDSLRHYPFHYDIYGISPQDEFTAIIYSQMSHSVTGNSPIYRLLRSIARSQYVTEIIVIWCNDKVTPQQVRWPSFSRIRFTIIHSPGVMQRFRLFKEIHTEAILSLDEDVVLTTDEIDFAFQVWKDFPDRIVGYPARSHYWDEFKNNWGYTSKWTNDYSIVLTGAAFYHKYYNYLYTEWLGPTMLKTVEQSNNCEDILMNFLVSHVTRQSPIKVTQRKHYKEQSATRTFSRSPWNDPDHFTQRQVCLNTFVALFGYMPLVRSNLRLDPILFKDPVSNLRKKYRQIELVES